MHLAVVLLFGEQTGDVRKYKNVVRFVVCAHTTELLSRCSKNAVLLAP